MRRAAAVDANQREIVAFARGVGASVAILSRVGQGVPDLLIGIAGRDQLVEIKDGSKPPSARRVTEPEAKFIREWRGSPVVVVETLEDMHALIKQMRLGVYALGQTEGGEPRRPVMP